MRIPHDAMVMVADGAKLLFFRNAGGADHLDLVVETAAQQQDAATRDQGTDRPGRAPAGGGGVGSHPVGQTDFHQQAEDRFAADAAALLNARAEAGAFKSVVVVAPPKTLGGMRKHYGKALQGRLAGELAKDLTGHPVDRIAKLLAESE